MEFHAKEVDAPYKAFRMDMWQAAASSSRSSGTEGCCTERAELGGAASRLCAAFRAEYDASVWRSARCCGARDLKALRRCIKRLLAKLRYRMCFARNSRPA